MFNNNSISLYNSINSFDSNGNAVATEEFVDVNGYVDFSKDNLKIQKNGENIIAKYKIFITNPFEIEKITFIPNKLKLNEEYYDILNYEKGINHIEITI